MQTFFNSQVGCSATDTNCLNGLSVSSIINAQMNLFNDAVNLDPSTGIAEPIRPVKDGSFITSPLDATAPFPRETKPLLITNVNNESTFEIFGAFTDPLPMNAFAPIVNQTFGSPRTQTILSSSFYAVNSSASGDARFNLQVLGTDYLWKCSGWTFARNWVNNGGQAYVGMYVLGATYPGNEQVPACTQPGVVCHQDDIEIVVSFSRTVSHHVVAYSSYSLKFGTVPNPSSAQSSLISQMQKRYASFLATGNPNANSIPQWPAATTSNVNPILLGGKGSVPVGACTPQFWGKTVEYDYQVFDI
jgi:carboxylesterase type B